MSPARRRPRAQEHEEEEHENEERWLLTYADMVTLLMVLFIVMFSISQVDREKFLSLRTGLAAGFGAPITMLRGSDKLLDLGTDVRPENLNMSSAGPKGRPNGEQGDIDPQRVAELARAMEEARGEQEYRDLEKARKALKKALAAAGLPDEATFRYDERGLVVSIATDDVLFANGRADLRPKGRRILAALAPTLRRVPNRLSIDGHTNSIPISTEQYPSNWELSADRACGVLRHLTRAHQVPLSQMTVAAYADTRPLLPSSDPRSVVINRRVEIVVLASADQTVGRAVKEIADRADHAPSEQPHAAGTTPGGGTTPPAGAGHD